MSVQGLNTNSLTLSLSNFPKKQKKKKKKKNISKQEKMEYSACSPRVSQ